MGTLICKLWYCNGKCTEPDPNLTLKTINGANWIKGHNIVPVLFWKSCGTATPQMVKKLRPILVKVAAYYRKGCGKVAAKFVKSCGWICATVSNSATVWANNDKYPFPRTSYTWTIMIWTCSIIWTYSIIFVAMVTYLFCC